MNNKFLKSKIYFVSAGPGDPELLTVKAAKILKKSDAVFYAGSLINPLMLKIIKKGAELIDIKSLNFEEIKTKVENILSLNENKNGIEGSISVKDGKDGRYDRDGKDIKRGVKVISILHAGDSSIYSAINEQMAYLEEMGVEYEIVPGVTAAFAASAANKSILTMPDVSQTVIFCRGEGRTGKMPEGQDIKSLAKHGATMAIYLSFGLIKSVTEDLLESYNEDTPCLIAKDVSLKSQFLINCKLKDVIKKAEEFSIKNMAVLIVGEALNGKYFKNNKSKLYDKNFYHGYRDSSAGL
ncbi:MAG: cobalt-precorrin-4 C(11)-methyltransferase [Candidatus Acidulodesulfobacterium acidiphilum]|uniref:Cobalt-precorrin-4 C(11)-methyltransferase n=1 Tax=Candidatus Acidulodesulfobacterium acidiphilum TaxID=2597224 RepID=A0A520X912_9DELT|nr:MAG: cobalt-precorrin-4 C(11)-methyltransferase [Candidatus Acidulodesulfobacterium acidiphilum]